MPIVNINGKYQLQKICPKLGLDKPRFFISQSTICSDYYLIRMCVGSNYFMSLYTKQIKEGISKCADVLTMIILKTNGIGNSLECPF